MEFSKRQTAGYGLGAVGKDMVYALSASYVMYYYQDILGISATFVGVVLMAARVFDALNDPFMGIIVEKSNPKFGKFSTWILSGSILNAFVLYALFSVPSALSGGGLRTYFAIIYVLWGVTYTMMDIPFWSMIPAVTREAEDREKLSVVGRTCAGIGNALITVFAMKMVTMLGNGSERSGFSRLALIVAVLFALFEILCVHSIQERKLSKQPAKSASHTATVKEMFQALFRNDQAMVVVGVIVLIDCALYITSNLLIYFFKYDFGGSTWYNSYTLFNTVGGASQILGMMVLYPLLRKKLANEQIFRLCLRLSMTGYVLILIACLAGLGGSLGVLCIPGVLVFLANGMLTVLTTVFLSSSVDYGELTTGSRQESVIFSMQTFVVKASSAIAVLISGVGIDLIGLVGNSQTTGAVAVQSASTLLGLRLLMTVLPFLGLFFAMILFRKKFKLTDQKSEEMIEELKERHSHDA